MNSAFSMTGIRILKGNDNDERVGNNIFVKWIKYKMTFAPYLRVLGTNKCHTGEYLDLYLVRPRKGTNMPFPTTVEAAVD